MPVMAEISTVPVGTGTPGVGEQIAAALRALDAHPEVRWELTAMGTTLVGELDAVLAACGAMHTAILATGAPRCYTVIKIDQRTDKAATIEEKVASVERHLAAGQITEQAAGDDN